ncbi:protein of unknown function DUF2439 [Babesia duncani]|uniref:5'-3' DNA helicase ZGRF1-like N-terminal domain-containing protein n=1 Tax=Babesia duncani TaxID=323732 RepID=A0AAD9PNH2_9APIC|nr:protein of unknown function DUF2439 [Babesia duncani]
MVQVRYECQYCKKSSAKTKNWRDGILRAEMLGKYTRVYLYDLDQDQVCLDVGDIFNIQYNDFSGRETATPNFIVTVHTKIQAPIQTSKLLHAPPLDTTLLNPTVAAALAPLKTSRAPTRLFDNMRRAFEPTSAVKPQGPPDFKDAYKSPKRANVFDSIQSAIDQIEGKF